ncbi:hypothetical protein HII28_19375 [Planctomonas sp. JC2975]|uniref:hypothetical protein n=1 Tax=Planctomonas sp. JC2975 TaxID=2729626 RepID=UPI001474DC6D|nr:hypothetical protein [Planctomonas sp. JC2975]NNC14025.1 hypothetical protein [Planctomonas sp. JC2975]
MPTRYILRIQPDVAEDPRVVGERLARFATDSRAEEVCLFLCNMEFWDGHVTIDELERWLTAARGWRDALQEAGIAVSLNPANTLGHGDWDRTFRAEQQWQPMVDQWGRAATAQVCPLDPTWRDYFVDVLSRCARDGYGTVWIEDDIRLHNHMPLDWGGCFCPLHLEEFAARTGVETSREELVAACTAPGAPSPWRSEWMRMWDDTGRELLAMCRAAVDAQGSRLGLMSSRTEQHAAEGRDWPAWLEIPAAHRPHFWGYSEVTGREFASSVVLLDQQRGVQPAALESYPEIECWPYGAWNKSYAQTAAQMALAQVAGSDGLALSVTDFLANHPADEPGLSGFLAQWRSTMDWLSESFPKTMRSTGVGLPWSKSAARDVALDRSTPRWQSLVVQNRGWAYALLGTGHATTATTSAVNALSGESVWGFSDEELEGMFAGGLLLDAGAAVVLARRGFGHLIGVEGAAFVERPAAVVATREVCHDSTFTLRPGASFSVDPATWPDVPGGAPWRIMQGVPAEGARIISRWWTRRVGRPDTALSFSRTTAAAALPRSRGRRTGRTWFSAANSPPS